MDSKYMSLHETPIRAAIDIYDTLKSLDSEDIFDKAKRSPYASTSIARIASNMTLVFPVLCSTNLHIDTDMMIMKALERKYTVMLQILFSAYQVTDVKSAQEFISRFHSNIRLSNKATVDDFIDLADTFGESGKIIADKNTLALLSKDFRENCFFILENDIEPESIGDNYHSSNGFGGKSVRRPLNEKKAYAGNAKDIEDAKEDISNRISEKITNKLSKDMDYQQRRASARKSSAEANRANQQYNDFELNGSRKSKADADLAEKQNKAFDTNQKNKEEIDSLNIATKRQERELNDRRLNTYDTKQMKDMSDYFRNQLLSTDIKKANELVPTTMVVNFKYVDPESGRATPLDNIVLGIKARMIPVDSDDIVNHLLTKLNDRNFITQLIRATTREISFFKDFLLAIDNAKIEALANSKRGSANPMWKVLERRAIMSRMKRFIGIKGNNANAITALVVSQEEVEYVRKNFGKNFDSIKTINAVMDAYNLIGFVIVDESMETAKFVFDTGEDQFETLAFNVLEREASDNSYKKIVNLLSKVG